MEASSSTPSAFAPTQLGGLNLRNRLIKSATYEGMSPGGYPSRKLLEHHRALARGGVGLTTVAYCAVHETGRTFPDQMVMDARRAEELGPLVDAVHDEGAKVCLQLAHCGGFTKDRTQRHSQPPGPIAPSASLNRYGMLSGLPRARPMSSLEIGVVVRQFADAALQAKSAGFDAIELHMGHGYLLSQFISPALNHRRDEYGGTLSNRLRFPLAVVEAVREAVGDHFALLAKINLRDHIKGGLEIDEAIQVAQALEAQSDGVNALVLSGGLVSHSAFYLLRGKRPLAEMIEVEKSFAQRTALRMFGRSVIEEIPFEELFFLDLALKVRAAVKMPLVLLGGAVSRQNLDTAMSSGFDFVAMGRALIENPRFVLDLVEGKASASACNHCNQCIAEMDRHGVRCVLHD